MSYERRDRDRDYSPRGRGGSRSRSRSPPRGGGRGRSRSPVRGDRAEPTGTSMMVRNLARQTRPEDLRYACEKYGRVRDIYLPRDYYTQ